MPCSQCGRPLEPGEAREYKGAPLCEGCCLEMIHPDSLKPHYKNDSAGFMRRLKETYSVIKQEND
ncbi:hypothetical protein AAU61_21095 [Desulfocarbo indianensis]|nr:hypothetical protein AAU61_21095 [Desulfocarbo indianensis]